MRIISMQKSKFLIQDLCVGGGDVARLRIAEGLYILEKDTYAISTEKVVVF